MRKHWLLGAISGFFFGLSLSIILAGLHVVRLDSIVLTLLPVLGLVLGTLGALWAPRGHAPQPAPAPATAAAASAAVASASPATETSTHDDTSPPEPTEEST
jgi:hypothetical protein